jgi:hypothetical protein
MELEMSDCSSFRRLFQRVLAGAPVDEEVFLDSLDHIEGCERCRALFDLAWEAAYPEKTLPGPDVSEKHADPAELFELAMTAAMSDSESITRLRAAERLGRRRQLGPAALEALAQAAATDPSEEVRAVAAAALEGQDRDLLERVFVEEPEEPVPEPSEEAAEMDLVELLTDEDGELESECDDQ